MIEQLRIQGIGVIADAQVDLGPGLTVITGETGAGKTMILSGIELLRGARAESGQLRESGEQAEVDAVVTVDQERQKLLGDVLEDLGVDIEDDALIARCTDRLIRRVFDKLLRSAILWIGSAASRCARPSRRTKRCGGRGKTSNRSCHSRGRRCRRVKERRPCSAWGSRRSTR